MHRRRFLVAVGAAATGGCATGDEPGDASATGDVATGTGPGESPATTTDRSTATTATRSASTGRPTAGVPAGAGEAFAGRPEDPLLGVSLSPQSFDGADFAAFFDEATTAGSLVRWAGDWAALEGTDGAPSVVASLLANRDAEPLVETGAFAVGQEELFRPLSAANRSRFVDAVSDFVRRHRPLLLGLGVEVNLHRERQPSTFDASVSLFERAAAAIGDVAPETRVAVGFQYEWLVGRRGGLFGGEHDPSTTDWDLLDRFQAADVIALTTYPGLVFRTPAAIPDDYYAPLVERIDRPVAITETGWSHLTHGPGWERSEAQQAAYVTRLFDLLDGVDPSAVCWTWLYDQAGDSGPFEGMTLRRDDGTARPAFDAWLEHRR